MQRLDGLPLAIELAAARVKLLPPAAILTRLADSLGLLVSGSRDVPDRQRTLRATIAWSHDLLREPARRLLAACSVFRGGIGLDHIEAVCASALRLGVPVLDALNELSTRACCGWGAHLRPGPRYAMLETVRDFAAEQLGGLPEHEEVRDAHAAVFWDLAKDLARPPSSPGRAGLDLLELEHDNFRAALDWYRETDPAMGLRLANRLTGFWSVRGHFSEGRRQLGDLLDRVPSEDPERVDALNGAAWLATDQGDRASALGLLDESIRSARAAHDPVREAAALNYRGRAKQVIGDPAGGRADVERALELQTQAARRRPRGGPVSGRGGARTSRTTSGSPSNGSNAARSCPRRLACPPSKPGPSSCSACPAWSAVTCRAPRRRSPRVCRPSLTSAIGSPSRSG